MAIKLTFIKNNRDESPKGIAFMDTTVRAGFPSPAMDFEELGIDLNTLLVNNPSATFLVRVSGDSMQDAGIHDGDLLIVDKSKSPDDGNIAVCFLDGEFTLKSIELHQDHCYLVPHNPNYPKIKVNEENELIIWGVVVHVIKSFK